MVYRRSSNALESFASASRRCCLSILRSIYMLFSASFISFVFFSSKSSRACVSDWTPESTAAKLSLRDLTCCSSLESNWAILSSACLMRYSYWAFLELAAASPSWWFRVIVRKAGLSSGRP